MVPSVAGPHLFSPVSIGPLTARNRILMSAMSINFGVDAKGYVTDQLSAYLEARARGGAGMVLVGGGGVHPTGLELPDLPALWEDGCVPALAAMTRRLKTTGALVGMQLMHGGRQSYHDNKVAPSAIPAPAVVKGIPHALTAAEIETLTAAFGSAARRCRQAGFDFVEIHAAHGYLINQFLAPNSNHRKDAYGGGFENRIRFLLEVLAQIRHQAGDDFPVGVRINGSDYIDGGWQLSDALRLAPICQKQGAAYLHVSAGVYGSRELTIPSMYADMGCFAHLAEAVKATVSLPVIAVGRLQDPALAQKLIREEKADVIALGRALLADPNWPNKVKAGQFDRVRPCIGCCLGCIHAVLALEPGGCVVNPEVGREYLLDAPAQPLAEKKRVLVIGAGPAGLAAARAAGRRGHQVQIVERQPKPGGLMRLSAMAPGRADVGAIIDYFTAELERLQIPIQCEAALTDAYIRQFQPDVAIVATGSLPRMPLIKGLARTHLQLFTVTEVLEASVGVGRRVIVLGGGQAGLLLADHLATTGCEVALLNRSRHFGEEMSSNDRYYLRERLKRETVSLYGRVAIVEITADGVVFKSAKEGHTLSGWDTLVLAEAMDPVRETVTLLRQRKVPYEIIGDAKSPRNLMLAISEGEDIATTI